MKQLRFNHSFINLIALYARICIQWKLLSSWEWWWSIYCSINHFTVLFCRRFSLFLSLSISISPYSLLVPDLLPCKDVWDFFLLFFSTYGHIINEIKDVFKLVWYHFEMRFMATNILLNESLWLLLFLTLCFLFGFILGKISICRIGKWKGDAIWLTHIPNRLCMCVLHECCTTMIIAYQWAEWLNVYAQMRWQSILAFDKRAQNSENCLYVLFFFWFMSKC